MTVLYMCVCICVGECVHLFRCLPMCVLCCVKWVVLTLAHKLCMCVRALRWVGGMIYVADWDSNRSGRNK